MNKLRLGKAHENNSLDTEEGCEEALFSDNEGEDQEDDNNFTQKSWDEGGLSDCGYADSVHDTLMSIGKIVHFYVGEPSDELQGRMKGIGSYFQEASYTVRDFQRGKLNIEEGDFLFLENEDDDIVDEEEKLVTTEP
eukprot:CAMPEP_0172324448 /NCGR_PEP_ID=MMETSP1058-20130122/51407_1 /TAXON_ID=83371 /ORGANISM="Detonula confervacea, Strain CCMP 353" /LENGTH=136 /DNA_ID=CAMNT_0013040725 /DNA_START=156 /DNA_END=566 /DNA_ORIENTATION=+